MHRSTTCSSLLPLLGLALVSAPAAALQASQDPYREALRRAIERAQRDLVEDTDLGADHSTWEDPWVYSSDGYEVRTTHSHYLAADVARGLDVMRDHFQALLGTDLEPPGALRVFVLPDLAAYNQFGDEHGAEHSSFYGSFFPAGHPETPVAVMYDQNPTQLRMWITHSAVHQYLHFAYPSAQPPVWLSEGLASYFSLFWDASYGDREIRRLVAAYEPPNEGGGGLLSRMLGNNDPAAAAQYVPVPELLAAPLANYTDRSHSRLTELGMLFTYLLAYREDTRSSTTENGTEPGPFALYVRAVLEGRDPASMPIHALLTEEAAELDADFRAWFS